MSPYFGDAPDVATEEWDRLWALPSGTQVDVRSAKPYRRATSPGGALTLKGLSEGANVYVDGEPVLPRDDVIRIAPGTHELPIELLDAREAERSNRPTS